MDENKLNELLGNVVQELGAAMNAPLVVMGDKLGLFKALAADGKMSPAELSEATGTAERYIREWLAAQAASGFINYDADRGTYWMSPEQTAVFADESSPVLVQGGFQNAEAFWRAVPRALDNFKTGEGMPWGEHDACLFEGTARFLGGIYRQSLVNSWIPAMKGIQEKLERGARVADVGCGFGTTTVLMAKAFPNSRFIGIDSHGESIEAAHRRAREANVGDRVEFHLGRADDFGGGPYDLVCHFDCLHDLGDPLAAATRAKSLLSADGSWMVVEPAAGDSVAENLNPVSRVFYTGSTLMCVAHALSEGGAALGAQAGGAQLGEIAKQAGFSSFERAVQTPFNHVYQGRP